MKLIAILAALVLLIAMLRKAVKPKRKLTIEEIEAPYIYAAMSRKRRW